MSELAERLAKAGRIDRLYVQCETCSAIVLDSAEQKIRHGKWGYIESVANTAMESHRRETDHIDFNAVIQNHRSRSASRDESPPELNVTVTTNP